jgi:hypothetical protein
MTITKTITVMNTNDVCKFPSIEGRREMSVGCDDERFISPKECCKATYRGGSPSSLTKSELAQLYFPGAPRSSALRLLHKYITSAHGLLPALERVGYQRASRRLTRRQVMIIFEYLGEP